MSKSLIAKAELGEEKKEEGGKGVWGKQMKRKEFCHVRREEKSTSCTLGQELPSHQTDQEYRLARRGRLTVTLQHILYTSAPYTQYLAGSAGQ